MPKGIYARSARILTLPIDIDADTGAERYPLLMGLLHRLPARGYWSHAERDRWVAAFVACLALETEIVTPPDPYRHQSAMKEPG